MAPDPIDMLPAPDFDEPPAGWRVPARAEPKPLRAALGRFATGVAIVTARSAADAPVGVTINSFASVSLDPPLVLFSLSRSAGSFLVFRDAAHFGVSVLAASQQAIAMRFASLPGDRFAGVAWREGPNALPLIEHAAAQLACRLEARHDGGDHVIFVGRVEAYRSTSASPLVFHAGRYVDLQASGAQSRAA